MRLKRFPLQLKEGDGRRLELELRQAGLPEAESKFEKSWSVDSHVFFLCCNACYCLLSRRFFVLRDSCALLPGILADTLGACLFCFLSWVCFWFYLGLSGWI